LCFVSRHCFFIDTICPFRFLFPVHVPILLLPILVICLLFVFSEQKTDVPVDKAALVELPSVAAVAIVC
jgi:hypothetical protein